MADQDLLLRSLPENSHLLGIVFMVLCLFLLKKIDYKIYALNKKCKMYVLICCNAFVGLLKNHGSLVSTTDQSLIVIKRFRST